MIQRINIPVKERRKYNKETGTVTFWLEDLSEGIERATDKRRNNEK